MDFNIFFKIIFSKLAFMIIYKNISFFLSFNIYCTRQNSRIWVISEKDRCVWELCAYVCAQSLSCVQLFMTQQTVAHQAPLSVGFPRQEYWSGLPFPSGVLPDLGIKPISPAVASPAPASEFWALCCERNPIMDFGYFYPWTAFISMEFIAVRRLLWSFVRGQSWQLLTLFSSSPCA